MRYTLLFLAAILASGWIVDGLAGQVTGEYQVPATHLSTTSFPLDSAVSESPSLQGRILSGLAAAALGAGIGFFASQVATGDWDEQTGRHEIDRSAWAAVGGASGFLVGFSVPVWGRPPGAAGSLPFAEDRFVIDGAQIRDESLSNALEAVRFFHPEWLVLRGQEAIYDPAADAIRVYLDNAQLGGVENLAGINTVIIESIRFYDGRQAVARWGTGHAHGVIQVISRD